jgi:hypothetical protein
VLQQRPNTFAQTILSLSFFACDKAADHTFRLADNPESISPPNLPLHKNERSGLDMLLPEPSFVDSPMARAAM